MIKIRLARGGAKNNPSYRVVAIESHRKRGGKPLDILGYWYPVKDELKINKEKLNDWVSKGAQTSSAVSKLLDKKQ